MSNSSYGGIFISKGIQFRSAFPMRVTHPLVKVKLCKHVRAGLPANDYAGHSFRIGAATTAAVAGWLKKIQLFRP